MKMIQRQMIQTERTISSIMARSLLVEARINIKGKLDVYEKCPTSSDFIQRIFTLDIPDNWDNHDPDKLLDYARDKMPNDLTFGQ